MFPLKTLRSLAISLFSFLNLLFAFFGNGTFTVSRHWDWANETPEELSFPFDGFRAFELGVADRTLITRWCWHPPNTTVRHLAP